MELSMAPYRHVSIANPRPGHEVPWSGSRHVQCTQPKLPGNVEEIANTIAQFADQHLAWHQNPATGEKEFVVEFTGCTDGFNSLPEFFTGKRLRARVRLLLLLQVHNQNVVLAIGSHHRICLKAAGRINFDAGRAHIEGEILSATGAFVAKTANRRKGTSFAISLIQTIACSQKPLGL